MPKCLELLLVSTLDIRIPLGIMTFIGVDINILAWDINFHMGETSRRSVENNYNSAPLTSVFSKEQRGLFIGVDVSTLVGVMMFIWGKARAEVSKTFIRPRP